MKHGGWYSVFGIRFWSVFGACVVLILVYRGASAHAILTSAEPAAGSTLDTTPAQITLTFSEPIGAESSITLIGENFRPIPNIPAAERPAPNILAVALPDLEAGVYTVEYDTLSIDGHTIRGAYEFAIEAGGFGRIQWQTILFGVIVGIALRLFLRRNAYR
ncbi:MAG: copper resistance CopC family protein [Candidatus Promineifilaceae bacterium]